MQPDSNASDENHARLMAMLDNASRYMLNGLYEQANELIEKVKAETQFDPAYRSLYATAERISAESAAQRGDTAARAREALTTLLSTPITLPEALLAIKDPDDGLRASNRLEVEIAEAIDVWNEVAQGHLATWRQSLELGKEDIQLKRFSRDVDDYPVSERRRLYVTGVENICDALYNRADELMNADSAIAPATILRYYDAVQSIVRDAAGKEERLEPLRQRAEQRRTERALANVTYTSAVQGEQYESELQRLRGMKPGSKVPRTRFAPDSAGGQVEVFEGYIPVETAIEELQQLATNWAGLKLLEYLDRADTLLREHNPNAAEVGLIEDRKKISAFIFGQEREEIEARLTIIRDEKARLDRAARLASEALDLMNATLPSPMAAWEQLQNALREYEWAPKIDEARRSILNHLRSAFDEHQREADSLFVARKLAEMRTLVANIERAYGGIQDSIVSVEIEVLRKKRDDLEKLEQSKLTATTEMRQIRLKATENPLGAENDLANFRSRNAPILNEIPEFFEVETEVMRSMGAQQTADRLERDINSQILDQVSDAVKLGREALKQYPDHAQLKRVVSNLVIHEMFLRARQADGLKKYEDAYKYYSQVMENLAHPDYVEANAAVDRLRRQQDGDNVARYTLERAKEQMSSDPVGAFRLLRDLQVYSEQMASELAQQRSLARTLALEVIQQRMKAAQSAAKIPIEQVQEDLNTLQHMNWTDEYTSWSALFDHAMAAQRAESLSNGTDNQKSDSDLAEAIKEWESAIRYGEESNAKALPVYRKKLAEIKRRYASTRLTTLRSEIADQGGESQSLDTRIAELEEDLKKLIEMNSADGEVQLWRAQLAESIGRFSLSPTVREAQFRTMLIFAESSQQLLKGRENAALLKTAKEMGENAQVSLGLAAVMKQIEPMLISKDVASVREAVSLHKSKLVERAKEAYHSKIREWWEVRVDQSLREANDAPVALKRPNGSIAYDRLTRALLINPTHPQAVEIMGQIDQYWANDRSRLNQLIREEHSAAGFNKPDGWERLDAQIKAMESFLQDLDALAELKRTFSNYDIVGARLSSVQMERYGDLKEALERLTGLQEKLQGVRLSLIEDSRTGHFERSESLLSEVETFQDHPAYQQVLREIDRRRSTRTGLEETLRAVQQAISAGCFHDAYNTISTLDEATVVTYGLHDRLTMRASDKAINDLGDLEAVLEHEAEMVRTILAFALPFGIRSTTCSYDGVNSSPLRVIDWQAWQGEIRALVRQGRFSQARSQLESVLRESTAHLNLQEAVSLLENPPYGEGMPTVSERYAAAHRRAQYSPAALEVLDELKKCLDQLDADLKSAAGDPKSSDEMVRAGEIAWIAAAEYAWNTGWHDWELAVSEIAAQFDLVGGVKAPRLDDRARRGFTTAVEKAQAAYEKCAQVCPDHPHCKFMIDVEAYQRRERGEGLYLFWWASQLVSRPR